MTTDLETRLGALGSALDRHVPPVGVNEILERSGDTSAVRTHRDSPDLDVVRTEPGRRRRTTSLLAAAAVLMVGLLTGLVVFVPSRGETPADGSSSDSATVAADDLADFSLPDFDPDAALSTRTELSIDDRVAPTWLPDGYSYAYSLDEPGKRQMVFTDDVGEQLSVSAFGAGGVGGEVVEIGGRDWRIEDLGSSTLYSRGLTGPNVFVSAQGLDHDEVVRVVDSLVVGGPSLAGPYVLDADIEYRTVASTRSGGAEWFRDVHEVNGWMCTRFASRVDGAWFGAGEGCGTSLRIDSTAPVALGLSTFEPEDRVAQVVTYGMAGSSVGQIEVVLSDGSSLRVVPDTIEDLDDVGFWIAVGQVDLDEFDLPSAITVERVVAADDDGVTLNRLLDPFNGA